MKMAAAGISNVLRRLQHLLFRFETSIASIFKNQSPPLGPALAVAGQPVFSDHLPTETQDTEDGAGLWDGLLWAVPKKRRSKETNRTRRRAVEKMIKRVQFVTTCETCGHPKKLNFLCGNCLSRIREETKMVQEQIMNQLDEQKDGIADAETSVLYEGEEPLKPDQGRDIVEVKKKRPYWFPRDLTRQIKY